MRTKKHLQTQVLIEKHLGKVKVCFPVFLYTNKALTKEPRMSEVEEVRLQVILKLYTFAYL